MATYAQRAQAIGDALINGVATAQQIDRLGVAFARQSGNADHYAGLTNAGKAEFLVKAVRSHLIAIVTSADVNHAAQTASSSAATDLPENP